MNSLTAKGMDSPVCRQFWITSTNISIAVHQIAEELQAVEVGDVEVGGSGVGRGILIEAVRDLHICGVGIDRKRCRRTRINDPTFRSRHAGGVAENLDCVARLVGAGGGFECAILNRPNLGNRHCGIGFCRRGGGNRV